MARCGIALSDPEATGIPHFATAIGNPGRPFSAIRLTWRGQTATLTERPGADQAPIATAIGPGLAHLSWNHQAPAAMVRDETTGRVVAILGEANQAFRTVPGHSYQVHLSNGLGSRVFPGITVAGN